MQKRLTFNWKNLLPAAAATGIMLLTPLFGVVDKAEAKSHGRGRALGHHKQSNWKKHSRRSSKSHWDNGVRRRTRTRRGWDSDSRRYRLRYRTRYDRFGNPYRQWYRSYF